MGLTVREGVPLDDVFALDDDGRARAVELGPVLLPALALALLVRLAPGMRLSKDTLGDLQSEPGCLSSGESRVMVQRARVEVSLLRRRAARVRRSRPEVRRKGQGRRTKMEISARVRTENWPSSLTWSALGVRGVPGRTRKPSWAWEGDTGGGLLGPAADMAMQVRARVNQTGYDVMRWKIKRRRGLLETVPSCSTVQLRRSTRLGSTLASLSRFNTSIMAAALAASPPQAPPADPSVPRIPTTRPEKLGSSGKRQRGPSLYHHLLPITPPAPSFLSTFASRLPGLNLSAPQIAAVYDELTQTVWVRDPESMVVLWRRGFFGKGSLSRSDPSWRQRVQNKRAEVDGKEKSEHFIHTGCSFSLKVLVLI